MAGPRSPRISICVPAYQAEAHLGTTLSSVSAQSGDDIEIVVLDNASTDETASIAATAAAHDHRIRIERNRRVLPLPENWNRLVALSAGELIKIVCADDLVHPLAIQRQSQVLFDHPEVALVASRRHLISDDGTLLAAGQGLRHLVGRLPARTVVRRVVRNGGNPLGEPGGAMFRRRDFDRVGGFDATLLFPMDLVLWLRLLESGDFVGQSEALAAFRAGASSLSSARSRKQYDEQRTLTHALARDPRWQVPRTDELVGAVGARWAEGRRNLLFRASAWPLRRSLARLQTHADDHWLRPSAPLPLGEPGTISADQLAHGAPATGEGGVGAFDLGPQVGKQQ